jgi:hypothetical protein
MTCERCGERDAAITLTRVTDGAVVQDRRCAECAADDGVALSAPPYPPAIRERLARGAPARLAACLPRLADAEAAPDGPMRRMFVAQLRWEAALLAPEQVPPEVAAFLAQVDGAPGT